MSNTVPRRDFLRTTATLGVGVLGAGYWLGTSARPAAARSPNEKLNLAFVGIGGQGRANLDGLAFENVVALCDVDDQRAGDAYTVHPKAKKFYDFRKMFDEMHSGIDGVVVSTPDHTHFHPAWTALQHGKHVYLEKPLAHSVWEVRKITDLAREKKVATQLGVQRHTLKGLRRAVEIVKSGAIGDVTEVHSWIASSRGNRAVPTQVLPVPSHLKWDLWLGPTKSRDYTHGYAPYDWRFFWEFGTGESGNFGCHVLDIPFWALDLAHPNRVDIFNPDPHPQSSPTSLHSLLHFPATDKHGPVKLHWYQGVPKILAELKLNPRGMNNLFIGTEGMLLTGFDRQTLLPEEKFADFQEPEPTLYSSPGFREEWTAACRGGAPASCNFDYSGPLSETVLLANVAFQAKGGFDWDAAQLKQTGNDAADPFLTSKFEKGWEI